MLRISVRNLIRRRARTILTMLGIAVGVAAVLALSAMARGLDAGYRAMFSGSNADLVISQPDSFEISYSSVDEGLIEDLLASPEVENASGMLQGFVRAEDIPFFFVFGYPETSFLLARFHVTEGSGFDSAEARSAHGTPILLGSAAAGTLERHPGETVRLNDQVFRVIGIYETGDAFEDSGAVTRLPDAQALLGKGRQVSLFYIKLRETALRERFVTRAERLWPDLDISGTDDFADRQIFDDAIQAYAWGMAGLALVIGGVGMMNSQLMAVSERTREIGVLRAVGWSRRRVLFLILGESLMVGFLGGVLGLVLGWLAVRSLGNSGAFFGASASSIKPDLVLQAFLLVAAFGVLAGLYPAYRASRLAPVEALRYEGGSAGNIRRLPFGGMEIQSLWQRSSRTLLTFLAIGLTVGAIMALEAIMRGVQDDMQEIGAGSDAQVVIRQAEIADTSLSAVDERIGERIAAMPEVENVSGMMMYAATLPDTGGFFVMMGYSPNEYAIRRFEVVEGKPISGNHQVMLGRLMSETMHKAVGESIDLSGYRFRVVGIYESGVGWEELGGVVSLRDAQSFAGRPRKVTLYMVKVKDPLGAPDLVGRINEQMPEVHAALTADFVEQMPDMENADRFFNAISFLAIAVGGLGVLNTMLMSVHERTREIGVLRAVGWGRRPVLTMILKESLILSLLGGGIGILVAFGLVGILNVLPYVGGVMEARWQWDVFARAIWVALLLGLIGGLYPAYRATRMQPVEALRYE
jgi:ABC-type antimicrobial peptide transport system permease subunit